MNSDVLLNFKLKVALDNALFKPNQPQFIDYWTYTYIASLQLHKSSKH